MGSITMLFQVSAASKFSPPLAPNPPADSDWRFVRPVPNCALINLGDDLSRLYDRARTFIPIVIGTRNRRKHGRAQCPFPPPLGQQCHRPRYLVLPSPTDPVPPPFPTFHLTSIHTIPPPPFPHTQAIAQPNPLHPQLRHIIDIPVATAYRPIALIQVQRMCVHRQPCLQPSLTADIGKNVAAMEKKKYPSPL